MSSELNIATPSLLKAKLVDPIQILVESLVFCETVEAYVLGLL